MGRASGYIEIQGRWHKNVPKLAHPALGRRQRGSGELPGAGLFAAVKCCQVGTRLGSSARGELEPVNPRRFCTPRSAWGSAARCTVGSSTKNPRTPLQDLPQPPWGLTSPQFSAQHPWKTAAARAPDPAEPELGCSHGGLRKAPEDGKEQTPKYPEVSAK